MAGLDPAIHLRAMGRWKAGNCVDARVKPAHDDLWLLATKETSQSRFPDSPAACGEGELTIPSPQAGEVRVGLPLVTNPVRVALE
jgi:hypothetical protein